MTASTTVLPVTDTLSPAMPSSARFAAVGLGGGEAQIGEVVDDHAVVLLGHRPVVLAQAGLDVHEREPVALAASGAGDGGVGVALHDHHGGRLGGEGGLEPGGGVADLRASRRPPIAEPVVGRRDAELGQELAPTAARRSAGRCG